MRTRQHGMAALAVLVAASVIGCGSGAEPKPDTGAPATRYKMVPATTGGGASPTTSTTAPPASNPATANPASPGSD